MNQLGFYFDFMSPYAYLAHTRLPELAHRYGYEVIYNPIDLPAAKIAAGNTGPPNVSIPVKIRYLTKDLQRWAARYRVPLKFPKSLKSERVNTAFFYAADRGKSEAFVRATFQEVWGEGGDMEDPGLLRGVANKLGWNAEELVGFSQSEEGRARFAGSNRAAQARGVFGAPIMLLDEEMWWGNDRLEFLEEHLKARAVGAGKATP